MIKLLIPDLPRTEQLTPWLKKIDEQRWYSNFGPLVEEFECKLEDLVPSAVASDTKLLSVSSGTAALELGLRLQKLPSGAKVLLPSFNFPAAAHVARNAGLTPVFTDVDPNLWILTPEIARAVMHHTRVDAVMPVATHGRTLPIEDWDKFAIETKVPVVVDAAAALGSQAVGRHTTVAFSLHATKPFGIGEGGFLASTDSSFIEQARRASNFGFLNQQSRGLGLNVKMSEFHAAVGLAQLERWADIRSARANLWQLYGEQLQQVSGVSLPTAYFAQPLAALQVQVEGDGSEVAKHLLSAGIETRQWYCPPLHHQGGFGDVECIASDGLDRLMVTDALAKRCLGLPFHTRLEGADVVQVCSSLSRAMSLMSE